MIRYLVKSICSLIGGRIKKGKTLYYNPHSISYQFHSAFFYQGINPYFVLKYHSVDSYNRGVCIETKRIIETFPKKLLTEDVTIFMKNIFDIQATLEQDRNLKNIYTIVIGLFPFEDCLLTQLYLRSNN